ncbi:hypothetical protein QFC19_000045 [Naganishia cerealis]|uniref:Uncharacterized protein n=1 Tax=Naganishia cerealis TaxID=610337 RepID=A0ACC2WTJ1_9TREE|nr:hypothetical protein QFC19_000045 [Naganishia cerealis]
MTHRLPQSTLLAIVGIVLLESITSASALFLGAEGHGFSLPLNRSLGRRDDATTSAWKIKDEYSGKTFFDGFTFYADADPNHGSQSSQAELKVDTRADVSNWILLLAYVIATVAPSTLFIVINYVKAEKAFADGLAFWSKDGTPGIRTEHTLKKQPGEYRDSVRIHSKAVYNGGLFIIDLKEMPWGCGVWPACKEPGVIWTLGVGAEWPNYVSFPTIPASA